MCQHVPAISGFRLPEAVQMMGRSQVDLSISDGGGGIDRFAKICFGNHSPVTFGLHDSQLTLLVDQKNLTIAGNGRTVVVSRGR